MFFALFPVVKPLLYFYIYIFIFIFYTFVSFLCRCIFCCCCRRGNFLERFHRSHPPTPSLVHRFDGEKRSLLFVTCASRPLVDKWQNICFAKDLFECFLFCTFSLERTYVTICGNALFLGVKEKSIFAGYVFPNTPRALGNGVRRRWRFRVSSSISRRR